MDAAEREMFTIVASPTLLTEFRQGLAKPYFRDRVGSERATEILAALASVALVLPDPEAPPRVLRDSSDDYLVALASASRADAIVTGDRDLLDHSGLRPPAVTPRGACELLGIVL
jgi:putative PIN family toxin of toxin-antitoxin system